MLGIKHCHQGQALQPQSPLLLISGNRRNKEVEGTGAGESKAWQRRAGEPYHSPSRDISPFPPFSNGCILKYSRAITWVTHPPQLKYFLSEAFPSVFHLEMFQKDLLLRIPRITREWDIASVSCDVTTVTVHLPAFSSQ